MNSSDSITRMVSRCSSPILRELSGSSVDKAGSSEVKQDSGNINKTQFKATPNKPSSYETNSGGGPRCQEAIGDTTTQTKFETISKHSNDLLLVRGNTLQSDEDSLKLNELMGLCTNLQTRVLDLEKTNTTQSNEITSLKRRVKKLEMNNKSRTHKLKRLYKVGLTTRVESSDEESLDDDASKQRRRIDAIDQGEEITVINVQDDAEMFDVDDLGGAEVFVAEQEFVSTAATTITTKELTLAQALEALKTSKPKVKGIVIQKQEEPAKIDADYQLVERLQAEEQEELSDAKKTTLFVKLLEKRRKHFAAKKAKEKRNKPPTQAQKKNIMCNYLKNMKGYKLKQLKLKKFDEIQEMFDKAFRRVNTFEDFSSELVERKEKREGEELIQERTKKQKVEDDKETVELKKLIEIISYKEEVAIDVIPLAVKSPRIVD
nr:hypothetical protein [Tanacetum cinerariifolium]